MWSLTPLGVPGTTGFGTGTTGGLFGQQSQTTSLFNKPFGQATTTQNTGFSFGGTSTLGQPNTNTMVRGLGWIAGLGWSSHPTTVW